MNTTEWFPATVDPVHVGYYQVRYSWEPEDATDLVYYYWNGERWQWDEECDPRLGWGEPGNNDGEFWRGLSERPA